ncbi:hypothetical protein GPJ56_009685 [Histomonas meleagridis]|uniref:uncharacterized protein n=1 Tax=Histomonas meleagridis TaxID=135588 RepID=UPI00355A477C|nr:hypothetical protein GPJ56_009685 [Histomonas meleagridis]KAH0805481.1 hypothetical protein GO595_001711 [Histomonas meleagridis]
MDYSDLDDDFDFEKKYSEIKAESQNIKAEIQKTQKEIEKEKERFAEEYESLEMEQANITDIKFDENDELEEKLKTLKIKLQEIGNWEESKEENDAKLEELKKVSENVRKQQTFFCNELKYHIRLLKSLGNKSNLASKELFQGSARTPRFTPGTPEAKMASSLFELRQTIIHRYAQSVIQPDCPIQ